MNGKMKMNKRGLGVYWYIGLSDGIMGKWLEVE